MHVVRRPRTAVAAFAVAAAGAGLVVGAAGGAQAATSYPTQLSETAPSVVAYSHTAAVRGRLTLSGTPFGLTGEKVQLLSRPNSATAWHLVTTKTTNGSGGVAFTIAPKRTTQVELRHPADQYTAGSTSAIRTIHVAYNVAATIAKTRTGKGAADSINVTVTPAAPGAPVKLQLMVSGKWTTITTKNLGPTSTLVFSFHAPKKAGRYDYRVTKAASAGYVAGVSHTLVLTVA